MRIGALQVGFISHTTFLFGGDDGGVLLTDPYFCGAFEWQGRRETHLQQPDLRPESIARCGAIFVSHAHADHCDVEAIRTIVSRTGAKVLAPDEVLERLSAAGLKGERLVPIRDGASMPLGELTLEVMGGYDNAFDDQARMNKFSLGIRCAGTAVWFSGDCHALPPRLAGRSLDAVFCWTSPDAVAAVAAMRPAPKRFVMMHYDRHAPGMFWCNRDPAQDAVALADKLPGTEVNIPQRLGAFAHFDRR